MYRVKTSKQFLKSFDKLIKTELKQKHIDEVYSIIDVLSKGKKLNVVYKDHKLQGEWLGYRECHIQGDLLLVYEIDGTELLLILIDIGSHSQLFD